MPRLAEESLCDLDVIDRLGLNELRTYLDLSLELDDLWLERLGGWRSSDSDMELGRRLDPISCQIDSFVDHFPNHVYELLRIKVEYWFGFG